ncbi:MAG TPA: ABC transporter ATP-binding protein [Streptosporangiaceae bacterium]|nr:ABC transporter ATP-binding protein [Streptosporangiaceae bacterium]
MRLDGVGKRYGFRQPWVVRDVSLEIEPGRLVRLEGRNGTGKSTLLRVIAGVSTPTKGTVTGRPVTGYVPERFPPALPFSARDYLLHLGRVHGLAGETLEERADGCLDRLGGLEFADIPLRTMSKGMCQKVAVAQALLPGSGLLVLDEAWTGLDVEARTALDDAVAERVADGGSVVFVDHDPRRLEHRGAERWRIAGGEAVRVSDGLRPSPVEQGGEVVVIEVTGCVPAVLDGLPDVMSVRWEGDRAFVRVPRPASDLVLRQLLAVGDDVHIRNVRPEPANGGQQ